MALALRLAAIGGVFLVAWAARAQAGFEYDKAVPLDAQEHEMRVRDGTRVAMVSYSVTPHVRAEGLLVTPAHRKGKTGAIVWMHSSGYYEQLPDAMLLAKAGAISLLIDPIAPDWGAPPATWREPMTQAVVSIRRGVDLLLQRDDVDPQRIAYAGHSYGAMMGVDAVAADRRLRAAVFEVGLGGMSLHLRTSPIPFAANIRAQLGAGLERAMAEIEPLDAIHFVGKLAPATLLFQSARLDPGVSEKQAQEFFDAASGPKTLRWYDTAHDVLDIAAISDRARFLATQLGLAPMGPILKAKIGSR